MKKLLLAIFTIASFQTFAQVNLDLVLTGPATGTTINNRDTVTFDFYIKNNGNVAVGATDTIAVQLGTAQNNQFVPIMNPDTIMHSGIAVGDSIFRSKTYSIPMAPGTMGSGSICFGAYYIKNDSVTFQGATCKTYLLLNSVNELTKLAESVKVYPNPVATTFNITMKSTNATVSVIDITGKLIETAPVSLGEARIDVAFYANGVYFYQIKDASNAIIKTGKFTVSH